MSFKQVPPEFYKFVGNFSDYDEEHGHQFASDAHRDILMNNAMRALNAQERQTLLAFVDMCLDGSHSDEDLLRLWVNGNPQLAQQPATQLYKAVRSRLRALGHG